MKNTILLLSACMLFSCTPQRLLKNGNYEKAYTHSLKQLKKSKKVASNEEVLNISLEQLIATKAAQKNKLITDGNLNSMEEALAINRNLQGLINGALGYVDDSYQHKAVYLEQEEVQFMEDCGNLSFEEGYWKLEKGEMINNKLLIREAHTNFVKASNYGYDDQLHLLNLMELSFESGQVIYGVAPENYSTNFSKYRQSNQQFLKIYSLNEIDELACDCLVSFYFNSPMTSDDECVSTDSYEKKVSDGYDIEIVKKNRINSDGELVVVEVENKIPKYKTITATVRVTETTRTTQSTAMLNVTSINSNCKLQSQSWCEVVKDSETKVDVCGDRNAITGCVPSSGGIIDSRCMMENRVGDNLNNKVLSYLVSPK